MEIVSKTILRQIITQCAGTQNIIKKLASCDPCGRKSGFKLVAFRLRLSIYSSDVYKKSLKNRYMLLGYRNSGISQNQNDINMTRAKSETVEEFSCP